ncbi:hypothetical protein FGO68_gene13211 [Halteria grandinella]|uniref:Uncharacterized protein n=1 Tax=Halteria grandinella TaxID=5974 RepID=A0A8J8NGA5_HALGN|nr:hypothetical protein FGO68_gene13211 [Halteria grandinella]
MVSFHQKCPNKPRSNDYNLKTCWLIMIILGNLKSNKFDLINLRFCDREISLHSFSSQKINTLTENAKKMDRFQHYISCGEIIFK